MSRASTDATTMHELQQTNLTPGGHTSLPRRTSADLYATDLPVTSGVRLARVLVERHMPSFVEELADLCPRIPPESLLPRPDYVLPDLVPTIPDPDDATTSSLTSSPSSPNAVPPPRSPSPHADISSYSFRMERLRQSFDRVCHRVTRSLNCSSLGKFLFVPPVALGPRYRSTSCMSYTSDESDEQEQEQEQELGDGHTQGEGDGEGEIESEIESESEELRRLGVREIVVESEDEDEEDSSDEEGDPSGASAGIPEIPGTPGTPPGSLVGRVVAMSNRIRMRMGSSFVQDFQVLKSSGSVVSESQTETETASASSVSDDSSTGGGGGGSSGSSTSVMTEVEEESGSNFRKSYGRLFGNCLNAHVVVGTLRRWFFWLHQDESFSNVDDLHLDKSLFLDPRIQLDRLRRDLRDAAALVKSRLRRPLSTHVPSEDEGEGENEDEDEEDTVGKTALSTTDEKDVLIHPRGHREGSLHIFGEIIRSGYRFVREGFVEIRQWTGRNREDVEIVRIAVSDISLIEVRSNHLMLDIHLTDPHQELVVRFLEKFDLKEFMLFWEALRAWIERGLILVGEIGPAADAGAQRQRGLSVADATDDIVLEEDEDEWVHIDSQKLDGAVAAGPGPGDGDDSVRMKKKGDCEDTSSGMPTVRVVGERGGVLGWAKGVVKKVFSGPARQHSLRHLLKPTEEGEGIPDFAKAPTDQWTEEHMKDWIRHVFVQESRGSPVSTMDEVLKSRELYGEFERCVQNANPHDRLRSFREALIRLAEQGSIDDDPDFAVLFSDELVRHTFTMDLEDLRKEGSIFPFNKYRVLSKMVENFTSRRMYSNFTLDIRKVWLRGSRRGMWDLAATSRELFSTILYDAPFCHPFERDFPAESQIRSDVPVLSLIGLIRKQCMENPEGLLADLNLIEDTIGLRLYHLTFPSFCLYYLQKVSLQLENISAQCIRLQARTRTAREPLLLEALKLEAEADVLAEKALAILEEGGEVNDEAEVSLRQRAQIVRQQAESGDAEDRETMQFLRRKRDSLRRWVYMARTPGGIVWKALFDHYADAVNWETTQHELIRFQLTRMAAENILYAPPVRYVVSYEVPRNPNVVEPRGKKVTGFFAERLRAYHAELPLGLFHAFVVLNTLQCHWCSDSFVHLRPLAHFQDVVVVDVRAPQVVSAYTIPYLIHKLASRFVRWNCLYRYRSIRWVGGVFEKSKWGRNCQEFSDEFVLELRQPKNRSKMQDFLKNIRSNDDRRLLMKFAFDSNFFARFRTAFIETFLDQQDVTLGSTGTGDTTPTTSGLRRLFRRRPRSPIDHLGSRKWVAFESHRQIDQFIRGLLEVDAHFSTRFPGCWQVLTGIHEAWVLRYEKHENEEENAPHENCPFLF